MSKFVREVEAIRDKCWLKTHKGRIRSPSITFSNYGLGWVGSCDKRGLHLPAKVIYGGKRTDSVLCPSLSIGAVSINDVSTKEACEGEPTVIGSRKVWLNLLLIIVPTPARACRPL